MLRYLLMYFPTPWLGGLKAQSFELVLRDASLVRSSGGQDFLLMHGIDAKLES